MKDNIIGECDIILGAWSRKTENSTGVTDAWLKVFMPDEELLDVLLSRFSDEDFKGTKKSGGRLMKLVLVEYDDLDETPPQYEESRPALKPSQVAAIICKDELFAPYCRQFLTDILKQMNTEGYFKEGQSAEEKNALVVRYLCSINSRSELDDNEAARNQFHEFIRKPFKAFKQQQVKS